MRQCKDKGHISHPQEKPQSTSTGGRGGRGSRWVHYIGGGWGGGLPNLDHAISWVVPPLPVTVTTGTIIFLVGDPNLNLHLPLLLGGGTTQAISPSRCWATCLSSCPLSKHLRSLSPVHVPAAKPGWIPGVVGGDNCLLFKA